jgi:hypothetical protein
MSNYTNEEIGIITMALRDNPEALGIFLNGLNMDTNVNKEYCDHTIINELNANTNNILEIDLTDLDESNTNKAIEFFYEHDFPKLEKLTMPLYAGSEYCLERLVCGLFREEQIDEIPSLTYIIFKSQGMTEDILYRIYNHFSLYTKFVRKIPQYTERFGMNAIYISVHNTQIQKFINPNWLRGFMSTKRYQVEYKNEKTENCPFIINVSR